MYIYACSKRLCLCIRKLCLGSAVIRLKFIPPRRLELDFDVCVQVLVHARCKETLQKLILAAQSLNWRKEFATH